MKCNACHFKKFHSAGSYYAVAEGGDDPYNYEYCEKGHWEGGHESEQEDTTFWDNCKDFDPEDSYNKPLPPSKMASNAPAYCEVCGTTKKLIKYVHKTTHKVVILCKKHRYRNFDKPLTVDKQGRNKPCKCGSGKKYKNCCLK